jgi:hypothetical protein
MDDCFNFIKENLDFVKNKLKINDSLVFEFQTISNRTVLRLINELQNSK